MHDAGAERVNFAKYQQVSASVHDSTYVADFAVDGIVSNFHTWRTGDNPGPHWLEVSYPRPVTFGSAHLYSGRHNPAPIQFYRAFRLQYHDGSGWNDIPGASVSGNSSLELNIIFDAPVTATRFRLQSNENSNRTVRQLAMFPPNPGIDGNEQGFPIGTDVTLNLAYQRPATASSAILDDPSGPGYAKNAFDGFLDDRSRWLSTDTSGEWLEVDLLINHAVGSAQVFSGSIGASEPRESTQPITDFKLQFWDGSTWSDIPGATITGNTETARNIIFPEPVFSARIRLLTTAATDARIQQLLLFPPRDGGYQLGREVIDSAPPQDDWGTFADRNYLIRCNISADYRLAYIDGAVVFASGGNGGRSAQAWQLLRNYRDGSYRIRHNESGKCLALENISREDNNLVVLEDYTGLPHQTWQLERVDATHFLLVNSYSGMALQSRSSTWANGNPIAVRPLSGQGLQQWRAVAPIHHPKKGIAAAIKIPNPPFADPTATWMSQIFPLYRHSSWSYSWGRQRSTDFPYMGPDHTFNPMQWGNFNFDHSTTQGPLENIRNDLQSNPRPVSLMGFNEPDAEKQANMDVANATARWPRLEALDMPLVSPGPVNIDRPWINDFYAQVEERGLRVDYTNMHWYKRPNSERLIKDIHDAYQLYGRPVWLTEFSAVRWSGGATWTHGDNYNFIAEFMWRAESLPYLSRYSLFNFRESADGPNQSANDPPDAPRSNSIRSDGTLTPFSELYATWDGVTEVLEDKAYHLHNHARFRRARNPSDGDHITSIEPDAGTDADQWFLISGTTTDTVRIVSTVDGRRIRYASGIQVGLADANHDLPATGWQLDPVTPGAEHNGWYFLNHPETGQRLQMDANGALLNGPGHSTEDHFKWRFIIPLVPDATAHPFATFESWAELTLGDLPAADRSPTADPDGDGLPNLLEYAFLTNPAAPGGSPFRIKPADSDNNTIQLVFPWNWRASGHAWQIRHSTDLADISTWPVLDPVVFTSERDGDIDWIRVSPPMADHKRSFYVIEIVEN